MKNQQADQDAPDMAFLTDKSQTLVPDPPPISEAELRQQLLHAPDAKEERDYEFKHTPHERFAGDPEPAEADEGGEAPPAGPPGRGGRGRKRGEIFDDCPVTPLGVRGDSRYFLDELGQMRAAARLDLQNIKNLFGRDLPKLWDAFPKWQKGDDGEMLRKPNTFDQDKASNAMIMATSEIGLFNPDNAVRGVGAWKTEDGALVYHTGEALIVDGKPEKPGKHGRYIYPAYPPIPTPAETGEGEDPVPELKRVIATWAWSRPDLDPMIALGLVGVQMLGGALDWRPVFWITAAAGAGKSEFQRFVNMMHGKDGVVASEDPTKSGITSRLGHSSLPVSLDEREPDVDERSSKNSDIITLARIAASGGEWLRGSSDQIGSRGNVYSAFLFSSILIPGGLRPQDLQRLIRLDMTRLPKDCAPLDLQPADWRAHGAVLKRTLIDRWPTFSKRMTLWRRALGQVGIQGRDADNWEVVAAMADMAEFEALPDAARMDPIVQRIADAHEISRVEVQDDAAAMLLHLKGQVVDIHRRGDHYNVAQWWQVAANLPSAPKGLLPVDDSAVPDVIEKRMRQANETLARIGMRVTGTGANAQLFIANQAISGLNNLFKGTEWFGGAWKQSALRITGAQAAAPRTLAGTKSSGTLIPIPSISGLMAFPSDRNTSGNTSPAPQSAAKIGPEDMDDFA